MRVGVGRVVLDVASESYRWQARVYDLVLEPVNAPLRQVARRLAPTPRGATVLDVGCGTGAGLAEYRDAGAQVLGTDPSAAMLQQAGQRLGDGADLRPMTGSIVPFPDRSADLVVVSLVLHSLARDEAVELLGEVGRVLRPGGRVVVTDFGVERLRFPRGWWTRALTVLAELAAGPTHARHCVAFVGGGGVPALIGPGWRVEQAKHVAGGNITITVLCAADPAVPG